MSTFLQLVQRLHREVGAFSPQPSAVTSQTNEALRLVHWVIEADYSIQTLWTDWRFLWAQASVPTIASQATLDTGDPSFPSDLNYWDFCTFKIAGDPLESVEWFDVRDEVFTTDTAQPSRVIIMPDNTLKFDPIPDAAYTIAADYYKTPTKLAANTDTSDIPVEFESAIIGRAMIFYANYENSEEIKIQGMELYEETLKRLENSQRWNIEHSHYKHGAQIEVIAQ